MTISSMGYMGVGGRGERGGFSLVEVLVVISIIAVVVGVLLPAVGAVRRRAERVRCITNQRSIVCAVNLYAADNAEKYPDSVATIGPDWDWNWQEPMMMVGYRTRSPRVHRSMSAYLRSYIAEAKVVYCPGAPGQYAYLEEVWRAGDAWDNPETPMRTDPVSGTYCFYWNYVGIADGGRVFRGANGPGSGRGRSSVLVSDYFGYDHWRSPRAFGSCELIGGAGVTEGTLVSSAYWSLRGRGKKDMGGLNVELHAGYVDGHVGRYGPGDVVRMRVSLSSDGTEPYPPGIGPGEFYLPGE